MDKLYAAALANLTASVKLSNLSSIQNGSDAYWSTISALTEAFRAAGVNVSLSTSSDPQATKQDISTATRECPQGSVCQILIFIYAILAVAAGMIFVYLSYAIARKK